MKTNRLEGKVYIYRVVRGKKAVGFANSYYYSVSTYGFRTVRQSYVRPSNYKLNAYEDCLRIVYDFQRSFTHEGDEIYASGCTVVNTNSQKFTFGCELIDKVTGEIIGWLYITADNNYFIPASECEF